MGSELIKFYINNIGFQNFYKTLSSALNENFPLKQKCLRANILALLPKICEIILWKNCKRGLLSWNAKLNLQKLNDFCNTNQYWYYGEACPSRANVCHRSYTSREPNRWTSKCLPSMRQNLWLWTVALH